MNVRGLQPFAVTHSGNACPNDVDLLVTSDGTKYVHTQKIWCVWSLTNCLSIDAKIPSFTARRGSNVPQSEGEGSCLIEITIEAAPNFQFSVASTTYHDYIDLGVGQTAKHYMTYYFQDKGKSVWFPFTKMVLTTLKLLEHLGAWKLMIHPRTDISMTMLHLIMSEFIAAVEESLHWLSRIEAWWSSHLMLREIRVLSVQPSTGGLLQRTWPGNLVSWGF